MAQSRRRIGTALALSLAVLLLAGAAAAPAHVTEGSGPFEVEIGWSQEPPTVSVENSVEVEVADAKGPVAVPAGALSVEVSYAGTAVTLPLVPSSVPGLLEAGITPTRPGTYSFHVTGELEGRTLDVEATCSDSTFECVDPEAGSEFPAKDPSLAELSRRLSAETSRAEDANDTAEGARTLAIVALGLAAAALAASWWARSGRRGGDRP